MPTDKYSATWVSHSSIQDFLQCPRAYYLKNIYKNPQTGHKIQLITPALALGQIVHELIESLSTIPTEKRFNQNLLAKFDRLWQKVTGKKGGFISQDQEKKYQERGEKMIEKIIKNHGPLNNLAVKIQMDLPHFWLSEKDQIILCGKIDWLEYLKESDTVHIIDFKTGQKKEKKDSLQLPIYHLLVHHCQQRTVSKASYWYLELSQHLDAQALPDLAEAEEKILKIAKKIKLAKQLAHFKCPLGEEGCFACRSMEKIIRGEAELVGLNNFNQDIFMLKNNDQQKDSIIL